MNLWGLLAFVGTIRPVKAAADPYSSSSHSDQEPKLGSHGSVVNNDQYDPLWTKYGLDKSSEYKYFQEPGHDDILGHYDIRFFKKPVSEAERSHTMTHMIRAYLDFFTENELETWIAHGTLLGWWWNGKIMPWDWDIDTQVSDKTLFRLADSFNNTIIRYTTRQPKAEYRYLLDINPWARQRDRGMGLNIIDARWIDVQTGLYIDITGISQLDPERPNEWQCKNLHTYLIEDIYPLRKTTFEGVAAKVPFRYKAVLQEEYTEMALTSTQFHNHTWDAKNGRWISDEVLWEEDERQYE